MSVRQTRAQRPSRRLAATVAMLAVAIAWLDGRQDRRVVPIDRVNTAAASPAVEAGGLIYVSGLTAIGSPAEASADVQSETRRILDELRSILDRAGSSLGQVVNVNVFLKRASDFDAMNLAYREYFQKELPARTTVAVDLPDGALVEMSAIAAPAGTPRETLQPSGWAKNPRPYSYIVRAGGLVFLAGLISRRGSDDQVVPGGVGVQTKTILDNAAVLLKTAGLSFDDVVAARVYLGDDSYFEAMNAEYRKDFLDRPPARSTAVAGLVGVDANVEIALVASATGKDALGPQLSPTLPVSSAVRAGRRLFLSGVVGNTDTNRSDAGAQMREAMTRIGRTLETAGATFADVVDSTLFLPDLWQRPKCDDVFREFFPHDPPARTLAGTHLVSRDAEIEVVMTAVK
jgi:2-iminobutanoate/2-iminopropanoate deaminase